MPDPSSFSASDPLAERYGRARPSRWPVVVAGLVGALLLVWLGWVIWSQSTPEVTSTMRSYSVVSDDTVRAVIALRLRKDDVHGTCVVRAYAADHSVVGELTFATPRGQGTQLDTTRTIRTERRATTVSLLGCTAPGQTHPR